MLRKLHFSLMLFLLFCSAGYAADWVNLFDGSTLNGWSVRGGFAKYHVEDGAIVGTTANGSLNTFLCTEKEYGNFILELEVKTDQLLNSGVQVRSHIVEKESVIWFILEGLTQPRRREMKPGDVYGYQVEVSNEEQGLSGFVYDEGRRRIMLGERAYASDNKSALKDNQWNAFRIECRCDRIQSWVNGIPRADFRDMMSDRGVIGLQVHRISENTGPFQVRFRNIRIQELK